MLERGRAGARRRRAGAVGLFTFAAVGAAALMQGCCCGRSGKGAQFSEAVEGVNVFMEPAQSKAIKRVAVLPFKAPTELIGLSIADMFVTDVLKYNVYELVERGQIAKVLNETELALSGISNARAMEVGQMTGADGVIIGTVSEYEAVAYKGNKYPSVGISVRLIDSQTGKIVWSADYAERSKEKAASMSEHARRVVHAICSTLYQKGLRRKK